MQRKANERHLTGVETALNEPDPPLTVATYLEEWLWGKQSLRASTHRSYETHVRRYLVPHLGHLPLVGLQPVDIERMYRDLALGGDRRQLAAASVRRVHATLMSALNTAVRRGLIDRNPAATVELPRAVKTETSVWSAQELRTFLDAIEGDRLHLMFLMLGLLGLRRGEVVALHWCDVDMHRGWLRVHRSVVRVGHRTVTGEPKTHSGARTIAIDDETVRKLMWHQCRQRLDVLGRKVHDSRVIGALPPRAVWRRSVL